MKIHINPPKQATAYLGGFECFRFFVPVMCNSLARMAALFDKLNRFFAG